MLDGAIDVAAAVANAARLGEIRGQFEARLLEVQPARLRRAASSAAHKVAAPLEIGDEPFLVKQFERDVAGMRLV